MQGPHLRKYGVQTTIDFALFETDGVDFKVDAAHASGDTKIMKDEGAEANTTNGFTDEGQGYSIVLTATEMQAARIVVYIVDQGTKAWLDTSIVIETYGNASAMHALDLDDGVRAGLTALPNAAADAAGGLPISDAGGLDLDTILGRITGNVALASVVGALNDAAAAGEVTEADTLMQYIKQLINILIGTPGITTFPAEAGPGNGVSLAEVIRAIHADVTGLNGDAMRGTDSAALASVCTEARLAELAAANLPADIDTLLSRLSAARAGYLDKLNVSGTLAHSDAASTYKADVSALATAAKLLAYVQLILRSDSAIETDNATELGEINADEGSGGGDYSSQADSQEAIRDRGDAAWLTGGGGSITDILNVIPLIPNSIDLANTAEVTLGLMLTNALDDLPTEAEITPGTISIDRKAAGGTSWSSVVSDAACSEIAGLVYYDEVFDSGSGYAEGDSIRITFKSQKITVAANDYEVIGATGRMFYTEIRASQTTLVKAAKVIVNKAVQTKATGAIVYYDDDGVTPLLTHTPTDGESTLTRTPS